MSSLTIYTNEELKKIQDIEKKILKVIIEICEKLSIDYFLVAGTALGAVRHNGFIPWDDDTDIGMLREDYRRFLKKAPSLLPSNYYLQSPYDRNQKCPYSYAKIRVDGTKFLEYCNRDLNMHQGIYLDIFPFDEVPDDDIANEKQFKKVQRLKKYFIIRETPDITKEPKNILEWIKFAIRRMAHYLFLLVPYSFLLNQIEINSTLFNGTGQKALANLDYPKRKRMYVLKDNLFPLVKHNFDGIEANIPGNYDTYLKDQYGEYMKYPPKDQRFGHKPYIIDLGNTD